MQPTSNLRAAPDLQSLEGFFALFSHEVRSQLTSAALTCNYIRSKANPSDDALRFHLDTMTGISQSTLDIIDNMLNTMRYATGRLDIRIKKKKSPFLPWLNSIADQFKIYELLQQKELVVRLHEELMAATITTDLIKLGQIVKNLLRNAFTLSRPRTIITLDCRRMNTGLLISVLIRRSKLPVDKTDVLFKPYQSLDKAYAGTGLGLFLVKVYTEKLQGTLSLQSNNAHTSITVYIPDCISYPSPTNKKTLANEKEPA